ncbi:MAG: hypothetical protein UT58_C0003G0015 [Microgenomates group bacterium GW2011_GWC1_39_7b]|uniref:Phosphoribosyltransferase n=3 Tax=Candidatus Woeseibacteriota TaxID=1752722 RepID=A0A0G0P285_9BACT|nr:MAG: hypothetical protein UT17_C0003G0227 [Candidatus Woesebacteria bacterium GW2011_GWB1_39_10]KKR26937.1 MAG: hypothetical protein UT58_C0003G0015 [Microgenomates group bacterium GW2011_GWC1_39_7b]KKR72935.1 MAG: hypothetical protein UU16_C0035G0016 [Candidatus Woesebacteria bacterium GW2011_GWA2_40_7]KKS91164.1 MAG: hypothetical protein UV66_C0001G0521 [Candidatus Woesebacteria bacterium GW2011_GWA1_43_12]
MSLLDLIFPKTCLSCGKEGKYICENCLGKARILKPACPYCEKPSIDGFTHTKCGKKYGLDGLTSFWKYEGVLKKAIWALKFKYATQVGGELASILVRELVTGSHPVNGTLVPIPIYWQRENVRGFNQSEEIGKLIAKEMGWKFIPDLLIKNKSTKSQVELTVEGRKQNLRGVFCIDPYHKSAILNLKSVILFDDVFTTGSTLKEAAKVLKRAGVEKVWGMTIAR